mmetsp:Transcript_14600/g.34107  ORF Transcript_14600/g.34107 Transcript_14600/m.34107 type:complete len:206 (+) Transcript_14600:2915-3532(+)
MSASCGSAAWRPVTCSASRTKAANSGLKGMCAARACSRRASDSVRQSWSDSLGAELPRRSTAASTRSSQPLASTAEHCCTERPAAMMRCSSASASLPAARCAMATRAPLTPRATRHLACMACSRCRCRSGSAWYTVACTIACSNWRRFCGPVERVRKGVEPCMRPCRTRDARVTAVPAELLESSRLREPAKLGESKLRGEVLYMW